MLIKEENVVKYYYTSNLSTIHLAHLKTENILPSREYV